MTEEGSWTFRAPGFFISSLLNSTSVGCIMVTSYCSSKNIQVRKGQFFCTHFACHIHSKKATSHTYKHEWMSYRHTHTLKFESSEFSANWPCEATGTSWTRRRSLSTATVRVTTRCLWFGHLHHLLVTDISKTEHFSTCCTALVNYDASSRFCSHDW